MDVVCASNGCNMSKEITAYGMADLSRVVAGLWLPSKEEGAER